MTVDYSYVAAFDVRNAIWTELQNAGLLNSKDYMLSLIHISEPTRPY